MTISEDDDAAELQRLLDLDAPTEEEFARIAYLSMSPEMRAWLRAKEDRSTPFVRWR